jgi:hypothetical protein
VVRLEIPVHLDTDPKSCSEWTQVDILPSQVLRLLQNRNRIHFDQAHGSPFTIPPFLEVLGYTGHGTAQQQMLTGIFDSQDLDDNVRMLNQHMKITTDLAQDPARSTTSNEVFLRKLRVWSESTTTSPSGMHSGHYKALISRHTVSTKPPNEAHTPES